MVTSRKSRSAFEYAIGISTIIACVAAVLVIPEVRQWAGLDRIESAETPTPTSQPTATPLIKILGPEGGIFWNVSSFDPRTDQRSYLGKIRGEYNGIDSSTFPIEGSIPEGYFDCLFTPATPCPSPAPTPTCPSLYTNVEYIAYVGFEDGEYCFMLIADKAQLFIDKVPIASVGFFDEPTKIPIRTEDQYVRRNMFRGEHEVKLELFKSQDDNLFVALWGKPENTTCSNIGPGWMLRPIP
jgi:hypothetical protein